MSRLRDTRDRERERQIPIRYVVKEIDWGKSTMILMKVMLKFALQCRAVDRVRKGTLYCSDTILYSSWPMRWHN